MGSFAEVGFSRRCWYLPLLTVALGAPGKGAAAWKQGFDSMPC